MTKREETIERLTKGINPKDKQILIDFWNGKGSINGRKYAKYRSIIEEFEHTMRTDQQLKEFLEETRSPYKAAWR